ncbi:MAG: radical SAM protein [Candidatus Magasanikbacteria bacterium]|nr:radical SAM protein [Candidatus Magasanikbacteria bacterium]
MTVSTKTHLPVDCVLAITYNCNSRCVMCDIWKLKNQPELLPMEFLKLPASLRDINISGGEPFLRLDLPQIITNLKKAVPRARMVISSNGFATDLIIRQMKAVLAIKPDIGAAISIDGIGETHNQMRGIPGGFDRAIDTVKKLKELGMRNLRLAYTATNMNIEHLSKVYNLSRELDIEFTHSYAQSSEFYFGGKQNVQNPSVESLQKQYEYLIKQELKTFNLKRWLRAYFAYGMCKFVSSKNPILSHAPGRDFFFLDPSGDIYPSVVHNIKLGNIKEIVNFGQFWCSDEMEEKRKLVNAKNIPVWMICTARSAMRKHPFQVFGWIVKNKLL